MSGCTSSAAPAPDLNRVTFTTPTTDQVASIMKQKGYTQADPSEIQGLLSAFMSGINRVAPIGASSPPTPIGSPPQSNPFNAWYWRTDVCTKTTGKLSGQTVALKDTVHMQNVPIRNGNALLEGAVSEHNATIVSRILDEGGRILGKTNCEDLCFSGSSITTTGAPVRNPWNPEYNCGGSSSGSAVAVATGDVTMAIAGDQGGSIRIPSCWSGVVGLKPTWGLVPYTGILGMERSIDHIGPVARTVDDVALLLSVVAGRDSIDDRQFDARIHASGSYDFVTPLKNVSKSSASKFRIGVIKEGFGQPVSDPLVDNSVRTALDKLRDAGAVVEEITIPMHRDCVDIWTISATPGLLAQHYGTQGQGSCTRSPSSVSIATTWKKNLNKMGQLSHTNLIFDVLVRAIEQNNELGLMSAVGRKCADALTAAYDDALANYDVIVSPTLPNMPHKITEGEKSPTELCGLALNMTGNTMACNVTGHPALTLPTEQPTAEKLPIGMMVVGKKFDESTVLQVAKCFEDIRGPIKYM